MSTRERRRDRGTRRGLSQLAALGAEAREARLRAGSTQGMVARAIGWSQSRISRAERGGLASLGLVDAARWGAALGLDFVARWYPGGSPVRDRAHAALLERFRARVSATFRWRYEAPLPDPRDQRAFDLLLWNGAGRVAVEAEMRLRDGQALIRALSLKQRDGGVDRLILLLPGTKANRDAVRALGDLLHSEFPCPARQALAALADGRLPSGNAIVMM